MKNSNVHLADIASAAV